MAGLFSLTVTGTDDVLRALARIREALPEQIAEALQAEAEIEMTESKRRVPVDTGALRSSGHVRPPQIQDGAVSVDLVYGGAAADYAVHVHENLEAFHAVGEAKYLESVIAESARYLPARVAKGIDLAKAAR